jgi:CRP/FNR family transcriptional regulator
MDERLLRAFPFLRTASPRLLDELGRVGVTAHLAEGHSICREGDRCSHLALLLAGGARVYQVGETGREITLFRLEPGDSCILTSSCILSDRPFPAHAVTERDTEAFLIPAKVFRRFIDDYPEWRRYVFELLSRRLADIIAVVEEVTFRRLDARLAQYLSHAVEAQSTMSVAATHEHVASELGSSREVVSRLLKELEREGLVQLARGEIRVLRPDALRLRALVT